MATTTAPAPVKATDTLKPANIAGVRWREGHNLFEASGRAYGITDGNGRWLSSNDHMPSYWSRLGTAREVAEALLDVAEDPQFTADGIRFGWCWITAAK